MIFDRRKFLTLLVSTFCGKSITALGAQSATTFKIGLLDMRGEKESVLFQTAIRTELATARHANKEAVQIIAQHAPYRGEMLVAARKVLDAKPQVVIAVSTNAARIIMSIAPRTPLIFVVYDDPVAAGLASTIQMPGRNASGIWNNLNLNCKRIELLLRAFPRAHRLALLHDGNPEKLAAIERELKSCQLPRQFTCKFFDIRSPEDLEHARDEITNHFDGVVIPHSDICNRWPDKVVVAVNASGKPAIFDGAYLVDRGALASLEPVELFEPIVVARFVAAIASGISPSIIPIERPKSTLLAINLETARQKKLIIPVWLLKRADKVVS